MGLDAINTVVIYRYSILAALPFLMQPGFGMSSLGWFWWSCLAAIVFTVLSVGYHMRYNPLRMCHELSDEPSIKLPASVLNQKCAHAIRHSAMQSSYREYSLSKSVIDMILTYASIQQLGILITQVITVNGLSLATTPIYTYGLFILQLLSSIGCVYYANILDTADIKGFYALSKLLKPKLDKQCALGIPSKPAYKKKWFETKISTALSVLAVVLSIMRLYTPKLDATNSIIIDALINSGLCLLALQILSKVIHFCHDKILEIIAASQAVIALFSAASTVSILTKQQWIKKLLPIASKVGIVNLTANIHSVSSVFYTVLMWVYGVSTYRVSLHIQHLKHIITSYKRSQPKAASPTKKEVASPCALPKLKRR
tara:strand:- start:57 stop:1169 length:1113 start_codon:yes stop_codon:yes gene_type:complete